MSFIRNLLVGLAGLLTILIVIGLFLPDRAQLERSETIATSAAAVYAVVGGFERFNEWSPWFELDPAAEYAVSEPPRGAGASFSWNSEQPGVGSGSQQILEVVEDRMVRIRLDFGADSTAEASFLLEPIDDNLTRVTWTMETEFGYDLAGRYAGLVLDKLIGPDYEKGLANLKALLESDERARRERAIKPPDRPEQEGD